MHGNSELKKEYIEKKSLSYFLARLVVEHSNNDNERYNHYKQIVINKEFENVVRVQNQLFIWNDFLSEPTILDIEDISFE